jgi:hypothetical protein
MEKRMISDTDNMTIHLKKAVCYLSVLIIACLCNYKSLNAQNRLEKSNDSTTIVCSKKHFVSTSVLGLLAVAFPGENTFYYQLDFGWSMKNRNNFILGAMAYQYRRPHSQPYTDNSTYDGYVLSYGPVFAYQHFLWRKFFVMPIANPLIMDYRKDNGARINKGFMLLCAVRTGYSFDFQIWNVPFFVEPSVEVNFWPINTNIPNDFKALEDNYSKYVFAPGLNFGLKF